MDTVQELKKRNKTLRQVARELKLNVSIVSQVIQNKYTGSEETKIRVKKYITLLLQDKEDLNPIIYNDVELTMKVYYEALKSRKFNIDETGRIANIYKILESFKQNQINEQN